MKILSLCLCLLFEAKPVVAAGAVSHDTQLATQLLIMQNHDMYTASDAIGVASDRIHELLLKWSSQPSLMSDPLKKAKAAGLSIIESKDHVLRIYNWYTRNGGTMQIYANVMQYRTAGGAAAFRQKDDPGESVDFTSIEMIRTTGGDVIYLLFDDMVGSTVDFSTGVRAMVIKGGKLQDAKVFKTKTASLSSIDCATSRATTKDDSDNYVGIEFVKATRSIKVPLINKDMTFANKYLFYKFDGQNFVYSGTVK